MPPSHRTALPLLCTLLAFAPAGSARAGDRLSPQQLVDASDAVVLVQVGFGKGKAADKIDVVEVFEAPPGEVVPSPTWAGVCLPNAKQLKAWQKSNPTFSAKGTWKKALKAKGYRAVIFLATRDGALKPTCETEAMLMENTSLGGRYAAFQDDVTAAIAKKRAAKAASSESKPAP